ncbi:Glycosyltransferase, catalytic subunit of cellulose synthase and poly-beta-1,6-N-acetylglucosamine synthase [Halovenus aranensis]|uniref:Glycosyltransferase, catalytic subunit of cellulose synthase and poly-beta-1,6-N-acetylglucosamine synthase n=1 Tax=Halovenus aranensis TaxID=890420 RepID=A0A1G8SM14_9EURY|nr:Glycosyltransferase, catalytic subunit of cellulose synthase and poly-beta-1,6-N-acetylglucosamine synthase [Halovenus aranensis]
MTPLGDILLLVGWVVLWYYLLVNGVYLLVHIAALYGLRSDLKRQAAGTIFQRFSSPFFPGVTVVVPAYNEEAVIVESVQSLLNLNYPKLEIVVVNDGSDDRTLSQLRSAFDLRPIDAPVPFDVPSEPIETVYQSVDATNLRVIDKENGGRADAVNAGIWLAEQPLFCTVDADSIIDRDGLLQAVEPFLEQPEETVATGGTIRVASGCTIENGTIESVGLPSNPLASLQTMEYLRAFYSGRLGLDRLNALMLISGAFGVFRTDLVREVGGYETDSITEDFELTLRLHRYLREQDRDYNVEFVPEPVVWTEVPESRTAFSRQRRRWYRGLLDTMARHRQMVGRRRYGSPGLFGYPAFLLAEVLGPLVEGLGYVVVPLAFATGAADVSFVLMYFGITVGVGVFLSWFGILSEVWSFRRYDQPKQVIRLLGMGILENFGFRQWKTLIAWRGLYEYFRGDTSWGEMQRSGFGGD